MESRRTDGVESSTRHFGKMAGREMAVGRVGEVFERSLQLGEVIRRLVTYMGRSRLCGDGKEVL